MFETVTKGFSKAFDYLRSKGTITEDNIKEGMREIRKSLLEADVNFKVVKGFLKNVTEKAVGEKVVKSVRPAQQIVKIVHDELVGLMGPVDHTIKFNATRPTVILLAGLQGSGKTTTAAKLAIYLRDKNNRKPLLVAADLQRPAAVEQLKVLGEQTKIPVFSIDGSQNPVAVSRDAYDFAVKNALDTVILDTAGRLHVDEALMAEVARVAKVSKPDEILLVVDSMVGQDAVVSAKEFNERLEINGVILTKLDGDARGGAALSVKAVTGKPIKFVGEGEKLNKLELFHPDRMAGRILGMGDIVTVVEKAQEQITQDEAKKLQKKMRKGRFTFEDFLDQMEKVRKMGGLKKLLKLIPGMPNLPVDDDDIEGQLTRTRAIIHSMTTEERLNPKLLNGSRRMRIAKGSGRSVPEINSFLKEFRQVQKMMKKMTAGGMKGMGSLKDMMPFG